MKFTKDNLGHLFYDEYTQTTPTKMIRINGAFEVDTKEGVMSCKDGWLALDADGDPYPIDAKVQAKTYAKVYKPTKRELDIIKARSYNSI
jgi:hypothetical protein